MNESRYVIIIDDDPHVTRTLARFLQEGGYEAEAAATGSEAIEKARQRSYDLALVDLKLPDIGGLELFKPLRNSNPGIELVVLTAYATLDSAVQALNEGASAYLVKPVNSSELLVTIKRCLEKHDLASRSRGREEKLRYELEQKEKTLKALVKSEARYRALVENQTEMVCCCLPDMTVTFANETFCRLLGRTKEEVTGVNWLTLMPEACRDKMQMFCVALMSDSKPGMSECEMLDANGQARWLEWVATPVRGADGRVVEIHSFGRDITERKHREEELNAARFEARVADKTKSLFLGAMTHELHTPLNAIMGIGQILREQYYGALNPKQIEYVKNILESSEMLLNTTNEILDFAGMKMGDVKLHLLETNVGELVRSSIDMIQTHCVDKQISLSMNICEELFGLKAFFDRQRIRQVIYSLLDNAVKFTPNGGSVTVQVLLGNGEISFMVTDTGKGIAAEHLADIFREFSQIAGFDYDTAQGIGLGLAISERIVKAHGGRIWAESEGVGKGSRFRFVIPVRKEWSGHE